MSRSPRRRTRARCSPRGASSKRTSSKASRRGSRRRRASGSYATSPASKPPAHVAGNRVLTWFLRELVARTSLIIAVYEGPGSSCCAYDEHRALLAPLEAGRVQDAVDLMTRHLQGIEGRLNLDRTPRTPVDLRDVFGTAAGHGLAS